MEFIDTLYGRPSTIRTQKCLFNRWIQSFIKDLNGEPWDNKALLLIKKWEEKKLSPQTIKSLLSLTKKYAWWDSKYHLDTRRYLQLIDRKNQQTYIKALTKAQARKVLKILEGDTYTLGMVAYHSGLRKGEIFGLDWKDINFIKGNLFVQRSYDGPTKNGRSRYVSLSKELETLLLDKIALKSDNCLENRIIGKKFDPNPEIKKACRIAGVPEITIHGFRHTFATLALDAGRPIKQVSEALGHSNVSITMDIYWQNIKGELDLGFL